MCGSVTQGMYAPVVFVCQSVSVFLYGLTVVLFSFNVDSSFHIVALLERKSLHTRCAKYVVVSCTSYRQLN